jgi:hypothetical protein
MASGGLMQLISYNGKQDRMLLATDLLNKRLLEIRKNTTVCNTIMLLNYKDTIIERLPTEITLMICKILRPSYYPHNILKYINIKIERTECLNTLTLCIQKNNYIKPPKDVMKMIFNRLK